MLLYFNSLKAKQAMKKSKEESSAVQQPPAGKMHEIDLESQFRDFFFMWAVDEAGKFIDTVHRD